MFGHRFIAAGIGAALLTGAAVAAHAEPAKTRTAADPQITFTLRDSFAPDPNQWGPQAGRRSLQWDSKKGRWGLKLDLDPPLGRSFGQSDRDVQAGAYFKITPSLRVGGAVNLGAVNEEPVIAVPPDRAPKVKLETAFKF